MAAVPAPRLPPDDPDPSGSDWLVPGLTAAVWATLLMSDRARSVDLGRTLVAVGGPVVLLSGLHARLYGYLHAPARLRWLALPVRPRQHFRAAHRGHRRGLARSLAMGTVAVGSATLVRAWALQPAAWTLLADWSWFAALAWAVEPGIAGLSAWAGRRFDDTATAHQMQTALGGGWTLPEAVVHLYAPALGLGMAMALALPGQLVLDMLGDGRSVPVAAWTLAAGGALLAVAVRSAAVPSYERGAFAAIPFLAEATKTLAGPAIPEPTPTWLTRIRDPALRLIVQQFHRLTPVPLLRLLVLAGATWLCARVHDPATLSILAAAVMIWLVPARAVRAQRTRRARWVAALPLPASRRSGTHPLALPLLLAPTLVSGIVVAATWSAS